MSLAPRRPIPSRHDASHPDARRAPIEPLESRRLLAAPVADAGGPYSVLEGQQLDLDATGSTDADDDIASYIWTIDGQVQPAKTVPTLTLTWGELETMGLGNGTQTYNVSVKVIDLTAQESTDGATLTINNAPPESRLSVEAPAPGFTEGNSVTVSSFVQFDWNAVPGALYTFETEIKLDGVITHTRSVITGAAGDLFLYELPDDGALEVRTTVKDSEGASALATVGSGGPTVFSTSVADVPVTFHGMSPPPTDAAQGQPFIVGVGATAASVDTLTYQWTLDRFNGATWVNEVTDLTVDNFKEFTPASSGSYRFTVTISDGDAIALTHESDTLTVAPSSMEATDIAYTGQLHFTTSSATDDTADVTVRATLVDGDGGDITRATVTFFNTETCEVYAAGVPVTAMDGGAGTGFATTSFSVSLAENPDFLHISSRIDAGGAYEVSTAQAIVSLSTPGDAKVKAGGVLLASSSSGLMGAAAGTEILFSINSRTQPVNGQIAGGLELVYSSYRQPDGTLGTELRTYLIDSTAVTSLSVFASGGVNHAILNATVDIYDTTDRKKKDYVLVHAGMSLEMSLIDGGANGVGDRIAVAVWNDGTNDMLFSSSWDGTRASEDLLSSGDISITRVS